MTQPNLKKSAIALKEKKDFCRKILSGIALTFLVQGALMAQNSSYDANTLGLGGTQTAGFGIGALTSAGIGAQYNSAFGGYALTSNTSGDGNTAVGNSALGYSNGDYNTAVGFGTLNDNISGNNNSALGTSALYHNIDGTENTAVGSDALAANTHGNRNVAVGTGAMDFGTTSEENTASGYWSLINSNGNDNCGYGGHSLMNNFTGWGLTGIGKSADVSSGSQFNGTALGYQAVVNANNKVRLGNANVNVVEGPVVYTWSDGRFKNNVIESDVKGLEFIKRLRPVVYNYDTRKMTEFLVQNMPDNVKKNYLKENFEQSSGIRHSGFIAQEVEKTAKELGYDFDGVHKPETDLDNYSLSYSQFVVPLVKAVQEQQVIIEKQKEESRNQIIDLQKQLEEQKQFINSLSQKISSATAINSVNNIGGVGYAMEQNIPNPFSGETTVNYTLPSAINNAYMAVYDLTGKQLASFPITEKGSSYLKINSEKLSAGIYIYSIIADGKIVDSKRMIVAEK